MKSYVDIAAAPPASERARLADADASPAPPPVYRVEVAARQAAMDLPARRAAAQLRQAGLPDKAVVRNVKVFIFSGFFDLASAEHLARSLLCDPVAEMFAVNRPVLATPDMVEIEISRRGHYSIPAELVAHRAASMAGLDILWFRQGRRWLISGFSDREALRELAGRVLANPAVEDIAVGEPIDFTPPPPKEGNRGRVVTPIAGLDDDALLELSRDGGFGLDLDEMRAIREHYREQGREPTDIELDTIAQSWSEHCSHKTVRGPVAYEENGRAAGEFADLLDETLMRATRKIGRADVRTAITADDPHHGEGAGIMEFDADYCLAVSAVSRNRPSAVDPRNGAAIAMGGCFRDTLATGCGGEPVTAFGALCAGESPDAGRGGAAGALAPGRFLAESGTGFGDYARQVGLSVAARRVVFHPGYAANPLVMAGTLTLMPKSGLAKPPLAAGFLGVAMGARTGRQGTHGALMASSPTSDQLRKAVAEMIPSWCAGETEKLARLVQRARDEGLWRDLLNVGAGGYAMAFAAMADADGLGARVDLDHIPAIDKWVSPLELWVGESEERMIAAVAKADWPRIRELAAEEEVEVARVAVFTDDGRMTLHWNGGEIGNVDLAFLRDGRPRPKRAAVWAEPKPAAEPEPVRRECYSEFLRKLLGDWNLYSRKQLAWKSETFLRATGIVGPLAGTRQDMTVDASVTAPRLDSRRAVALAMGICPRYSRFDPRRMAAGAIDEALRFLAAAGASPERATLIANVCWGNCRQPERLGALVRALRGCHDYSLAFQTPFIAEQDSLHNEYSAHGQTLAIPDTLLVTAVAALDDLALAATPDVKAAGNPLFLVGSTGRELGGSLYYGLAGQEGGDCPAVDAVAARRGYLAIAEANRRGFVRSMIGVAAGGLAVAASRMALSGDLGVEINLDRMDATPAAAADAEALLFSESASRILVEVGREQSDDFARLFAADNAPARPVGIVATLPRLTLRFRGAAVIDAGLAELRAAWAAPHGDA